jgi:hypothetical protein
VGNPGFKFSAGCMASNASGILTQDSLIGYDRRGPQQQGSSGDQTIPRISHL